MSTPLWLPIHHTSTHRFGDCNNLCIAAATTATTKPRLMAPASSFTTQSLAQGDGREGRGAPACECELGPSTLRRRARPSSRSASRCARLYKSQSTGSYLRIVSSVSLSQLLHSQTCMYCILYVCVEHTSPNLTTCVIISSGSAQSARTAPSGERGEQSRLQPFAVCD